jgi:hypothetical protein
MLYVYPDMEIALKSRNIGRYALLTSKDISSGINLILYISVGMVGPLERSL